MPSKSVAYFLFHESRHIPFDTLSIIKAEAADAVNTKILKPGGLYPLRQVATLAEVGGLKAMVGSMPEMGIGTAAGLHFALALKPTGVSGRADRCADVEGRHYC